VLSIFLETKPVNKSRLLKEIFLNDIPLIDVRAEVEFSHGAFPGAFNFPILTDEERRLVGISHKEQGPEMAESLGYELVSGKQRELRINDWLTFIDNNPATALYCFRGGKRSQIACQWLLEAGKNITRIPGGYKSMRNFLLRQFDQLPKMMIVSGKTGVGKTELLAQFDNSLDLEQHAHHRGSAFGGRIDEQPSQINFENAVAIDLLKFSNTYAFETLFVEDEGRSIGRIQIPQLLQFAMKQAPILLLDDKFENRVKRIYREYIQRQWQEYLQRYQEQAFQTFSCYLINAIDAIRKRLGGAAHANIGQILKSALAEQKTGNLENHKHWIRLLLEDYYDPMYNYQLDKKTDRIIYRGTMSDVLGWVNEPDNRNYG